MNLWGIMGLILIATLVIGGILLIRRFRRDWQRALAIPNAKVLTFEDGGHTCYIVHAEKTQPATLEFLKTHQPA